ncbi:NlpC/P60 family protein [Streptomonospora algeriensis]|uniref:NlpC/P60 family protein n=1 Tax=Streptomonospora algeriensis TaxID=995084 RepID=A0ABW3BF41_9ACTN
MISLFVGPAARNAETGSFATRLAIAVGLFLLGAIVVGVVIVPMTALNPGIINSVGGLQCTSGEAADQAETSGYADDSIPGNYLDLYRSVGEEKGVPWNILAGVGQVESKHGRWEGAGITEGHNDWGAAGPMQFGALDGSEAGNSWGGEPIMDADDRPEEGYGQDGNDDGTVSVYDPADAIPAAADYLLAHGVQEDINKALFAYNHSWQYVGDVKSWADRYAEGDFETSGSVQQAVNCELNDEGEPIGLASSDLAQEVVDWAMDQRGKPYVWSATGPDAFDCSGLTQGAYASIGASIPRVSQDQWAFGPKIPEGEEQPGDLVFFKVNGPGGIPGHVGMVIGDGLMVEAWCTDCGPIAAREYDAPGRSDILGFTRPLEHPDVKAQLGDRAQ